MTETKKKNIWYIVALSICSLGIVALICLFIWAFPYKSKDNESKENDTGFRVMKEERTHVQYDEEADYSNLTWYHDDTYYYFKDIQPLKYLMHSLKNNYVSSSSTGLGSCYVAYHNYSSSLTSITCQFFSIDYTTNISLRIRQYSNTSTSGWRSIYNIYPVSSGLGDVCTSSTGTTTDWSYTYMPFNLIRFTRSTFNSGCLTQLDNYFEEYIDSLETTFSYLASGGDDSSTQTIDTGNKIVIAQNFNPNVWLSSTLYNNGSLASAGGDSTTINLTGLKFESNGMTFDTIRFIRMKVDGIYISFDGVSIANENDISTYSNYYFVLSMAYVNSVDNTAVAVWNHSKAIINGLTTFVLTESNWINDSYRTLVILEDSETLQSVPAYSNMTTRQLLSVVASVNSNLLQQDGIYLIKQSINGISGLLNLTILPGITIGLLMFIPLIVSVILFIVKLVKK